MQKSSLSTNSSCVLYLGTIPYNWDVEIIKSVVCGSGPVVDVRCMMDNASKNKGFCFVEYATPLDAQRALRLLSQIKIEGRKKLRIEISKEGLRNPTPGAKPELQLNRNYLPSNVILPPEMLMNNPQSQQQQQQQQLPIQQQQQQQFIQRSLMNQNPQSQQQQQQQPQFNNPNDLIAAVSSSPQLQQIVTQLISNGMDINQITTVIQQFTSNNGVKNPLQPQQQQPQPPPQQQQFMGNNQFQQIPTNTVNPNNQQHNEIILPQQDNSTQLNHNQQPQQGNLGIPHHLMNASQYLAMNPQQHFLQQQQQQQQMHGQISQQQQISPISASPLAIKDKVSETLSTIAPGVLIELLTELKITLNGPQPNAGKAAQILHENPKLAVAAGQALLLMGIIDIDSINKTLNEIPTTAPPPPPPTSSSSSSTDIAQPQTTSVSPSSLTSSSSNTSNALPLQSDSNPNSLQQMSQPHQPIIDNFNPLASNNIAIATNPNTISNTQTPINNNTSNNSTFIHQPIPRNSINNNSNNNNNNSNNDNLSSSSTPNSLNSTSSPITTVTPPINGLTSSSSSATSLASNNQHNNMQQIPMNSQLQQQQQQLPLQQQQAQQQLNDKNIAQYSNQVINPDWIGLSPNTISKLQNISNNEASLIVQVLKLSNQQIDILPENEKRMAIQIRNQYL